MFTLNGFVLHVINMFVWLNCPYGIFLQSHHSLILARIKALLTISSGV